MAGIFYEKKCVAFIDGQYIYLIIALIGDEVKLFLPDTMIIKFSLFF